jgi:acetyltransferase (GNAT) family protein
MKPLERKTKDATFVTRPYEPKDRDAVRGICCQTGLLGDPIDTVFSDHELFADYLTSYYTDWEPESTWVGEVDGEVVGYVTACKRWNLNKLWSIWIVPKLGSRVLAQLLRGSYDAKDKKFLKWILSRGKGESPITPKRSAHFHFNARKEHRRMHMMRDLLVTMLDEFTKAGVPRIHGQMSTFENKRSDQLFEYFGWKVIDKKKVTKYADVTDREVYLTTVVKDLQNSA